jgi:hypothetical protein
LHRVLLLLRRISHQLLARELQIEATTVIPRSLDEIEVMGLAGQKAWTEMDRKHVHGQKACPWTQICVHGQSSVHRTSKTRSYSWKSIAYLKSTFKSTFNDIFNFKKK